MYWRDDKAFYPAEIMGYDIATGRHEVEYDDGTPSESHVLMNTRQPHQSLRRKWHWTSYCGCTFEMISDLARQAAAHMSAYN